MIETSQNPLQGIEPEDALSSYDSLGLADWSDLELLCREAQIVSKPKQEFSSFAMHAPLELLARFCLLPLVARRIVDSPGYRSSLPHRCANRPGRWWTIPIKSRPEYACARSEYGRLAPSALHSSSELLISCDSLASLLSGSSGKWGGGWFACDSGPVCFCSGILLKDIYQ